jgi:hypothetical protein
MSVAELIALFSLPIGAIMVAYLVAARNESWRDGK